MLNFRNGSWHYDFTVNGVRYRGTTNCNKDMRKQAMEIEAKLKVEKLEKKSIQTIWEQTKATMMADNDCEIDADKVWECFSARGKCNADKHRQKIYKLRLVSFFKWLIEKYPTIKRISQITNLMAEKYWAEIKEQQYANGTKNDILKTLRMIFNGLGKEYGIIENPFGGIELLPRNSVEREAFTPEELRLIGQNATGWIYSLCLTAMSTGLREGDICTLKWQAVDMQQRWITVKTHKTGTKVEIPIMDALYQHLNEKKAEMCESEFVYPELESKYTHNQAGMGDEIKQFFERIGIKGTKKQVEGYAREVSVKDIHSFRHTFVYLAAVNGIPFPIVQSIVGHMTSAMTKHYMDHANRQDKVQYLAQLPNYLSNEKEEDDDRQKLIELVKMMPIEKVKEILGQIA